MSIPQPPKSAPEEQPGASPQSNPIDSSLLNFDPNSASPTEIVDWAKRTYDSGNSYYLEAWKNNSEGKGNLPNVYRRQYYDAYKTFKDTVGRDPTTSEYGQIFPAFVEQPSRNTGVQLVSSFAEREKNSPTALAGRASQYGDQVSGVFNSIMGRAPTADELTYFGKQLATGEVGNYELGNFLKNSQEYQDTADTKFRTSVGQELIPQQQQVFDKAKESIVSRYNRMGTQNSPALDFALTNLMGDLEKNRQGFLTNLKVNQYGGNKQAAQADYGSMLNNYLQTVNANRAQNQNMINDLTQRGWNNADYVMQRSDYLNALNSRGGSSTPWGSIAGGVVGGAAGAYFGGPGGAAAGYQIGSGLGGGYDYMNQNRRY